MLTDSGLKGLNFAAIKTKSPLKLCFLQRTQLKGINQILKESYSTARTMLIKPTCCKTVEYLYTHTRTQRQNQPAHIHPPTPSEKKSNQQIKVFICMANCHLYSLQLYFHIPLTGSKLLLHRE